MTRRQLYEGYASNVFHPDAANDRRASFSRSGGSGQASAEQSPSTVSHSGAPIVEAVRGLTDDVEEKKETGSSLKHDVLTSVCHELCFVMV